MTIGSGVGGSGKLLIVPIDKVYIDGSCVLKGLAGVLLARFERLSYVTHFYEQDQ